MEPQVIEIEPTAITDFKKVRVLFSLFMAAFWTISTTLSEPKPLPLYVYLGGRFWFFPYHIIGGLLIGLILYFLPTTKRLTQNVRPTRIQIRVERDQVTCLYQMPQRNFRASRAVRRGKVRSIFKIPGGIGVSGRSQFGARMLGFVAIRDSFPQYEELKAMLESWRVK